MPHRTDYQKNSTLRFSGTFQNDAQTSIDPDSVQVIVSDILDDYSQTTYVFGVDSEVTNPSVGVYQFEDSFPNDGIFDVTMTGTKDGNTVQAFIEFGIRPA